MKRHVITVLSLALTLYLFACTASSTAPAAPGLDAGFSCGIDVATGKAYIRDGDSIGCEFHAKRGLLREPVYLETEGKRLGFNGFYLSMNNCDPAQFELISGTVYPQPEQRRLVAHYKFSHPQLQVPVKLDVELRIERGAVRIRIEPNADPEQIVDGAPVGPILRLIRLGLMDHFGERVGTKRLYFGSHSVIEISAAFEIGPTNGSLPLMGMELESGLSEIVGTDLVPKQYRFDPTGRYDLVTYSGPHVWYTIALSAQSFADAARRYRQAMGVETPPSLRHYPGRPNFMAPATFRFGTRAAFRFGRTCAVEAPAA